MLARLTRLLFPADPVQRALSVSTMSGSLATGLFYSVSALYFTRVIGLEATTVGVGLTIAGAVGVAVSFAGGYACDRLGADRLQVWGNAVQAVAFLAYVLAEKAIAFTVIACVMVGSRSLQGTAKATVQARWFQSSERVAIRARLRVITNVFIGLGTVLAGAALVIDTAVAYQATMVFTGLFAAAATIPLTGLRARIPGFAACMDAHLEPDHVPGPSPLRDRTYVTSVALNSVIAMQFGLTSVGVPLWVITRTEAPEVVISALLVLNTVFVALFQVRAARGTHDIGVAGRTVRRGSLLLATACLVYGAAGSVGAIAAVVLLLSAELLASCAEIWTEAGGWGLAFELADPRSAGRYQGLSQTGYSIANMIAPALVTVTAVEHEMAGWVLLAAIFAGAGIGVAVLANRAVARRTPAEALAA